MNNIVWGYDLRSKDPLVEYSASSHHTLTYTCYVWGKYQGGGSFCLNLVGAISIKVARTGVGHIPGRTGSMWLGNFANSQTYIDARCRIEQESFLP